MAGVVFGVLPFVRGCLLGTVTDSIILAIGLTAGKDNKEIVVLASSLGGVHGVGVMELLLTLNRCHKQGSGPIPNQLPMICFCIGFTLIGFVFIIATVLALR